MTQETGYPVLWPVPTRWADNDHYGHVNNVTYYSYFDTAVNAYLIHASGTDIRDLPAIGIVAETSCKFLDSLSFPDLLKVGIRVARLGNSSISYELAIFRDSGDGLHLAATGTFVHVYVDEVTRKPVPIPAEIRAAVEPLVVTAGAER
ncbi:thioesterase family protein [Nocardia sp. CDC153]|uniref:acyl-CoA thioesterase n=1 Tax=Nocardia sp. CDC153 TaxID=3112167 RepID=UPI002DB65F8A|nr:thioesterase family protein [Nocardia sp. CDC153]MEC3954762.1 thioesterase family protein [Nocardia sp. CDC153]